MFERYTEKARRIIFFARYEASLFGSPFIETEHLLLGWLREDHVLGTPTPAVREEIRKQIESEFPIRKKISTSVDLPLSNESKRVLAYAAEEAERLGDRHIGSEHLLLGLLRESGTVAARMLNQHGIELKSVRDLVRTLANRAPSREGRNPVWIHGTAWDESYVSETAKELRRYFWQKRQWKSRDMLIERQTGKMMFHSGDAYDLVRFDLAKGAWKHAQCAICRWELSETVDPEHGTGYTNGDEWVCTECYEKLIALTDPQ